MNQEEYKLTSYAKGAGCGCKIAPSVLEKILQENRTTNINQANLLVGNTTNDDAAVYDIGNGQALLVTADFFMPIVDDAYTFGKIAAANAISDVYAMGGRPITAIALLGWPIDKLPAELAAKVMEGAKEICKEAGIVISGGHTIDSAEPFFGLSVNGIIDLNKIKRNSTAKVGDILVMTKSLGVGILATAQKREKLNANDQEILHRSLTELNSIGARIAEFDGVHAMTDITGFGIMGHLIEMAEGSGLSAELNFSKLPILKEVYPYMDQNILPDATYRNWNAYSPKTKIDPNVDQKNSFMTLPDPQTNGGLLMAIDPMHLEEVLSELTKHTKVLSVIGKLINKDSHSLHILP